MSRKIAFSVLALTALISLAACGRKEPEPKVQVQVPVPVETKKPLDRKGLSEEFSANQKAAEAAAKKHGETAFKTFKANCKGEDRDDDRNVSCFFNGIEKTTGQEISLSTVCSIVENGGCEDFDADTNKYRNKNLAALAAAKQASKKAPVQIEASPGQDPNRGGSDNPI